MTSYTIICVSVCVCLYLDLRSGLYFSLKQNICFGAKNCLRAKNIFGHVLVLPSGRFRRKFKKTCEKSSGENGRETGENSH